MPAPVAFVPPVVKNIEVFRRNLQELVAANVVATEKEKNQVLTVVFKYLTEKLFTHFFSHLLINCALKSKE